MQTGFRFRCYPTPKQEQVLLRWVGCQRFIYNAKVREDRYFRTFARKSLALVGLQAPIDQRYAQFIDEDSAWLREVPSVILRNGAVRWMQAYSRFFKRLAGRPTLQRKTGAQSVWLTQELFRFDGQALHLGTRKHPVGILAFKAHRPFQPPASIHLTVEAGRWFVSGSFDDGCVQPTPQETAAWLASFEPRELLERTVGVDRGVVIPACASTGHTFDYGDVQKARIAKKQAAARRWQRKLSRRTKGGSNRRKAARRIEQLRQYEKNVRRDFAHQVSHALVSDPSKLLIVFEDLGVQRMTRAPKARMENGRYTRNGAAAKAGLNASILASSWGRIKTYAEYKAHRAGKLCIAVPAHHTSQECAACGHVHPDNRLSQAEFVCQRCGHVANADANASRVIAKRGVDQVLQGLKNKDRKRTMRLRSKSSLGAECSEVTPGESRISRGAVNSATPQTLNQEPPLQPLKRFSGGRIHDYRLEIEGARRILREEWDVIAAQKKLQVRQAAEARLAQSAQAAQAA